MKATKKTLRSLSKQFPIHTSKKKRGLSSYDADFYQWTENQVNCLKKGEFEKLDIVHMIEEIESLGNLEKNAIESHQLYVVNLGITM
jgi:Domain of unknown function DUF29